VRAEHVFSALRSAANGPVQEGAVGAGTGMSAFGFKAGIGTASRRLPETLGSFSVGVLLVANFGRRRDLLIMGVPAGQELPVGGVGPAAADGSVMAVIGTDAPLAPHQLARVARRAVHGLARTGSMATHGSGDFVIAFSTSNRIAHEPSRLARSVVLVEDNAAVLNGLFQAAIESTEEAVYNALLQADTMEGRDGHVSQGLPMAALQIMLRKHHRLS
jgi:D-aminopeptidase